MDVHVKPAVLIGLERGHLPPQDAEGARRHLEACPLCAERQREIQAELAAIDSPEPVPGAVGRHIPSGLLAGFLAARDSIGEDLAARIEQHIARCPLCRDAAARAARAVSPRPEPAAPFRRPIPLAPFLRFRRGVAVGRDSSPRPRPRLFRRQWWPALSGLVLAVIIIGVVLPRWRASREAVGTLTVATPLRLLGHGGRIAPLPTVALGDRTPLALVIKLPVPPAPDQRYDCILTRADGSELKRRLPGAAFDRSGTVSVIVAAGTFRAGERIEVRVVAVGDASRAALFTDSFLITAQAGTP